MTQRGALSAVFRPDRHIYIVCFVDFSVLGASAPRTFLLSAAQAAFFCRLRSKSVAWMRRISSITEIKRHLSLQETGLEGSFVGVDGENAENGEKKGSFFIILQNCLLTSEVVDSIIKQNRNATGRQLKCLKVVRNHLKSTKVEQKDQIRQRIIGSLCRLKVT